MPIYSTVIDDNKIKSLLAGKKYQKILLLGCGECMNESLAFYHNTPVKIQDDNGNNYPYSIMQELKRLQQLLIECGYDVQYRLIQKDGKSPCMRDNQYDFSLPQQTPDIILMLSCPAGQFGVREIITDIPIIGISKSVGSLGYVYHYENGKKIMDKEKSKLIKFAT
jgi:hypothetical protein